MRLAVVPAVLCAVSTTWRAACAACTQARKARRSTGHSGRARPPSTGSGPRCASSSASASSRKARAARSVASASPRRYCSSGWSASSDPDVHGVFTRASSVRSSTAPRQMPSATADLL